jgi:hypothetical protein
MNDICYEVISLKTDESHGLYETLEEARGAVAYDRLQDCHAIYRTNGDDVCERVQFCDDFRFVNETDERVLRGMGLL